MAAAAIRLHVAGRARRGTSARGVTFEAGTLITTGMYALVRNPLYVANVLVWCGMAMLTGSLAVAAVVAAVAGIHFHLIVLAEERYLARRYGRRYAEYCRRVGRWLPRLGSRRRDAPEASPAPFTWSRALFREADTLFLLVLGGWLIGGLGHFPTPWHHPAQVAGAWYLVPVAPALALAGDQVAQKIGVEPPSRRRWPRRDKRRRNAACGFANPCENTYPSA